MIFDPFDNLGSKRKRTRKPPKDATRRELLTAGEKGTLANRRKKIKVTLPKTGIMLPKTGEGK